MFSLFRLSFKLTLPFIFLIKLSNKYNYHYLDITAPFTGNDGKLPSDETIDGLHLNKKGYNI